jgi:molecular chaperone IbpA
MTRIDYSPLFRSTIGFDRLTRMLDAAAGGDDNLNNYPPYNIEKTGEDTYRITLAVAGFAEADIDVELKEGVLTISGKRADSDGELTYLHQGIAERAFQRRFQLEEHVEAAGAALANGLLQIDLVRRLPEAMKPRRIDIKSGPSQRIEGTKAA